MSALLERTLGQRAGRAVHDAVRQARRLRQDIIAHRSARSTSSPHKTRHRSAARLAPSRRCAIDAERSNCQPPATMPNNFSIGTAPTETARMSVP